MSCSNSVTKVEEFGLEWIQNESQFNVFFIMPSILPLSSKTGYMKKLPMVQLHGGGGIFDFMEAFSVG